MEETKVETDEVIHPPKVGDYSRGRNGNSVGGRNSDGLRGKVKRIVRYDDTGNKRESDISSEEENTEKLKGHNKNKGN